MCVYVCVCVVGVEMYDIVQLPVSTPLTKPSHSRNHCMLMQYMTTGDSSSWNVLFSCRAERVGRRNKRGQGKGVTGRSEDGEGSKRRDSRDQSILCGSYSN